MKFSTRFLLSLCLCLPIVSGPIFGQLDTQPADELTVLIDLDASNLEASVPAGADVFIRKKGSQDVLARQSKQFNLDAQFIEVPFTFQNIPLEDLQVTVYSSSFKGSKWVGMKQAHIIAGDKKIKIPVILSPVDDGAGLSASEGD